MKIKSLLIVSAVALMAVAATAKADLEIVMCGSSAFRVAAHNAIQTFLTGETYVYSQKTGAGSETLNQAKYATFVGTHTGITGTVTIRCSWNGSAESVRAAGEGLSVSTLKTTSITGVGSNPVLESASANYEPKTATMGFSDAYAESVGISTGNANVENYDIAENIVGVIPFKWLANEGAPFTNITRDQIKTLYSNGNAKVQLFTGAFGGTNDYRVYALGRNNDSGTRITALADAGYGISNPVIQYNATSTNSNATIATLTNVGNAGASSGGDVAKLLGGTSTSVSVDTAPATTVYAVCYLGESDASSGLSLGAVELTYNGVAFSLDNVKNGKYTFWSYEHFYYNAGVDEDALTFITGFLTEVVKPANIGSSGIPLTDMKAARSGDGELVGI